MYVGMQSINHNISTDEKTKMKRSLNLNAVLPRSRHAYSSSKQSAPINDPSPSFNHPLAWYAAKLDTHPWATKMISSGLISGSGDLLCQYLNKDNQRKSFDWVRTLRFTILGSFLVAPVVHVWYNLLMTKIPGTGARTVAKRLFFDQGCFGPIFTPTFISCLTLLEHGIPDDDISVGDNNQELLYDRLITRLKNDTPEAIMVGWGMWVPSMAFMFAFIPGKFQVLFSNGVGFVWNAYLSWRTHEGEEEHT